MGSKIRQPDGFAELKPVSVFAGFMLAAMAKMNYTYIHLIFYSIM